LSYKIFVLISAIFVFVPSIAAAGPCYPVKIINLKTHEVNLYTPCDEHGYYQAPSGWISQRDENFAVWYNNQVLITSFNSTVLILPVLVFLFLVLLLKERIGSHFFTERKKIFLVFSFTVYVILTFLQAIEISHIIDMGKMWWVK